MQKCEALVLRCVRFAVHSFLRATAARHKQLALAAKLMLASLDEYDYASVDRLQLETIMEGVIRCLIQAVYFSIWDGSG